MRRGKILILLASLLIPLFFAGCADKEKLSEIENTQKDMLKKIASLEENQEKILKAFKPRGPEINPNKVYDIPVGSSPIKGNKNAPVTIIEFSDFQCPYCSRIQPTLKQVLNAYPEDVRLVYKHFPLAFHKYARPAAKASLAAREQGKFWEMHDIIFENYNKLTDESFGEFASKLGLDTNRFTADYNSTKYDQEIQQDFLLGQKVNVRGTPTLYLNGKMVGRRSFNDFKEAIDKILNK